MRSSGNSTDTNIMNPPSGSPASPDINNTDPISFEFNMSQFSHDQITISFNEARGEKTYHYSPSLAAGGAVGLALTLAPNSYPPQVAAKFNAQKNRIMRVSNLDEARTMHFTTIFTHASTVNVLNTSTNTRSSYPTSRSHAAAEKINFSGLSGGNHYEIILAPFSAVAETRVSFIQRGKYQPAPGEEFKLTPPPVEAKQQINSSSPPLLAIPAPVLRMVPSSGRPLSLDLDESESEEDEKQIAESSVPAAPAVLPTPEQERLARQTLIFNRSTFFAGTMALTEGALSLATGNFSAIPQKMLSTFVINTVAGLWINNLSSEKFAMPGFYMLTALMNHNPMSAFTKGAVAAIASVWASEIAYPEERKTLKK